MLAVLDAGLSVSNVIYYDHSNELVFNWKDYETKSVFIFSESYIKIQFKRMFLFVGFSFKFASELFAELPKRSAQLFLIGFVYFAMAISF